MAPEIQSYKLLFLDEIIQIKSDQAPEVIEKISVFLDEKLKELQRQLPSADKFKISALVAMRLAGELFELQAKLEEFDLQSQQLQKKVENLNDSLAKVFEERGN